MWVICVIGKCEILNSVWCVKYEIGCVRYEIGCVKCDVFSVKFVIWSLIVKEWCVIECDMSECEVFDREFSKYFYCFNFYFLYRLIFVKYYCVYIEGKFKIIYVFV